MTDTTEKILVSDTETIVIDATSGYIVSIDTMNTDVVIANGGFVGPPGAKTISESEDIDKSNLVDGSLLIYNSTTYKWIASKTLDKQAVDCGQF